MEKSKIYTILAILMLLVTIVSQFINLGWIIRDGMLLVLLIKLILDTKRVKISSGTVLVYYAICSVIIYIIYSKNFIQPMVTIRFVLLYPMLFFFGEKLFANKGKIKNLIKITNLYIYSVAILGIFELLFNNLFTSVATSVNPNYGSALFRSGIGYGLGSIFGQRVILGVSLCLGIVLTINGYYGFSIKNKKNLVMKYLILIIYMVLIILTVNRTAIVTAFVLIGYDILSEFGIKKLLGVLFSIILAPILIIQIPFFNDIFSVMVKSLSLMNLTLSGRTETWTTYFSNKISFFPNFVAFGNSEYLTEYLGAADSLYIKVITSYGLLIIPIIFMITIESLIKLNKSKLNKKFFNSLLIMLCLLSISIDTTIIVGVIVPVYIIIGYEYARLIEGKYLI